MAKFMTLALTSIYIGERARPIDEDHALAIASSIAERGLINPITVRSTPAKTGGKMGYTLVAGAHRYRAAELNQWNEIDAIVVSADAVEAQLMEISENLFRNELSALDRAIFVMKYREIHEEKFGKINPKGGRPKKQANDWPVLASPGKALSERVQERLGFGKSTYKYVTAIGQNLHPALRQAVRGTPAENDQKSLLKLAALPEAEQAGIAAALKHEPDLKKVLDMDKPAKLQLSKQEKALEAFLTAWNRMDVSTRRSAVEQLGLT